MSPIYEVPKDVVHHSLEGGRRIAQPKEHDSGFKQSPICPKGYLPLISLPHLYIVISPLNIQLGDVPRILDLVDMFLDEGKGITVLDSVLIELLIVLY